MIKNSLNNECDLESIHENQKQEQESNLKQKEITIKELEPLKKEYQVNEESHSNEKLQGLQKKEKRSLFTDWMRSIAIYLVVFTHINISIDSSLKIQKGTITSQALQSYLRVVLQFGMPIFFYFSGRSSFFSKDSLFIWIQKKFIRLILPLIFGTLVIVIPTAYIGRMYRPQHNTQINISFWEFYARYFPDEFTRNGFEWLWFLPVLFGCALANYPYIQLMKRLYARKRGEPVFERWNILYLVSFIIMMNIFSLVTSVILTWRYYGFPMIALGFMLISIVFMVFIDFFREHKILELFYLPCIICVLSLAAAQKYFTHDFDGLSNQISMFLYLDVFYIQGLVDEVTYKEYTEYRSTQAHQNRKPIGTFFFLILFCICMPGIDVNVGYIYTYPIYTMELVKVFYCVGTWFWIYFLVRWCQQFFDDYINKNQYKFLMESCMVTYLVHWLFLEIGNRYFVYQKIDNFGLALLILCPWTFFCCTLTYLICKKVPYIGLFLGLAEDGKTGSFKMKKQLNREEQEKNNQKVKEDQEQNQIIMYDDEMENQNSLERPLNYTSTDTQ